MNVVTRKLFVVSLLLALVMGCNGDDADGQGESSTETVGAQGGVVQSADGALSVEFPEGAVSQDAELTIRKETRSGRDDLYSGLYGFELDTSLQKSVTVSIDLDGEPGGNVQLGRLDGDSDPTPIAGSFVEGGAVVGELSSFSVYGAFDFSAGGYETETVIDEGGGSAESSDGRFTIEFAEGAFEEPTDVRVVNLSEQMAQQGAASDDYDTDIYQVMASADFNMVEQLGATSTVEIQVSASAEQSGKIVEQGRALGLIPGSQLDGGVITAQIDDLENGSYAGVIYEITQRCEDANAFGSSCSDYEDCMAEVGTSQQDVHCVCNDREVMVGYSCHGEVCEGVLGSCAGIGLGHDGFCDDAGGWAGDCYVE